MSDYLKDLCLRQREELARYLAEIIRLEKIERDMAQEMARLRRENAMLKSKGVR